MISSRENEIAFVHIPKCGGQSIRNVMRSISEAEEIRGIVDKGAGTFDYTHLTLQQLQSLEPAFLESLSTLESFCIVRDPFKRLPSSLRQRFAAYHGKDLREISQGDLIREVQLADQYLSQGDIPYGFVHFTPQHQFIELNGKQVVRKVADISQVDDVFEWLKSHYGAVVAQKTKNKTKVPSSAVARFYIRSVKPMVGQRLVDATPGWVKRAIRNATLTDDYSTNLIPEELKNEFVQKHYQRDFELHKQALAAPFFDRYPETRPRETT